MEPTKKQTSAALNIEELRSQLAQQYSPMATCWADAGDEVRDLYRYARETLGLDASQAINFKMLKTPGEWNAQGVAGIVRFYEQMTEAQRVEYIESNSWIWKDA